MQGCGGQQCGGLAASTVEGRGGGGGRVGPPMGPGSARVPVALGWARPTCRRKREQREAE